MMTKIEKQSLALVVAFVISAFIFVLSISYAIDQAGGVKQIIIDTGKEIKDISEKIDSD